MDRKAVVEYSKLLSEFKDIDEPKKVRLIFALKKLVKTEEYRYLKFLRLDRLMLLNNLVMKPDLSDSTRIFNIGKIAHAKVAYDLAEQKISEAEKPKKEPRKSHFRP